MGINICEMTFEDLELLSLTLSSDFDEFWSYSTLKNELENPNSLYFVAKLENNIIGFGGIWKSIDDVHIMDIVTAKKFRNQGVGSLLLEKLIDITKQEKYKYITLEVNNKNTIAQKLYLKYNFKEVGRRKNYYGTEDAIIMTLPL